MKHDIDIDFDHDIRAAWMSLTTASEAQKDRTIPILLAAQSFRHLERIEDLLKQIEKNTRAPGV